MGLLNPPNAHDEDGLSLREKYRDKFDPKAKPPKKRPRLVAGTNAEDVEDLLRKLEAKIGKPLEKRTLRESARQLSSLASTPDLPGNPTLCREGIECALGAVQVALNSAS